ncbi:phosphoribosyltransferase-like protein [Prosthecobacter dejongeii]|uniref:HD superfamily phosphohydrolase n=1 Tax=Prosthecobacter dejongeii TaxID=48465 RepID=A0A7W7YHL8_9BACT|nr:HD domain-containing protein [Prosthecobacter dejongeii]MBB5036177.1 HD superfamily phosphohydrolase [Prosthecobacter dejongeii]
MSADLLAELSQAWYSRIEGLEKSVNGAFDEVGFTDNYVDRMIDHARTTPRRSKVVKDNVWGMVELDRSAQLLLDSPVVQRLRRIRQLGLTYLTYPSAEHSRFVHSLGMYSVIHQLLASIRKNQKEAEANGGRMHGYHYWPLTSDLSTDLLHAAILHDIGHMPFSHATERAVTTHSTQFKVGPASIDEFMIEIEVRFGKNPKLAEALSLLVVLSPRFQRFYSKAVRPEGHSNFIYRVASLIIGLPPTVDERGAAELISATAIDADKIDYINRDAQACGIPVGIDFARLFLRSAFLRVPRSKLERLTGQSGGPEESMILIVNASGVDTLEELAHARTSLYNRVYLHQVTLCAEALLERGLHGLGTNGERQSNVLLLWADSDDSLLQAMVRSNSPDVARYGENLRIRQLPKRALVIGKRLVTARVNLSHFLQHSPSHTSASLVKATVGHLLERLREPSDLEEKILAEAALLSAAVAKHRQDIVPKSPANAPMFLPIRGIHAQRKDCLIVENGELMFSSDRNIADEQSDALEIFKSQAYVVGPPAWREFNALAAAKVLARLDGPISDYQFDASLGDSNRPIHFKFIPGMMVDLDTAARRAGVNMERLESIRQAANHADYFNDCPRLFPHPSDCPEVEGIAAKLKGFSGEGSWQVTRESVHAFVTQFPPRLRKELLPALKRIQILDRARLAEAMDKNLDRLAEQHPKAAFVITGFSPDSGSLTRMLFEQELKSKADKNGWTICKSIEDALDAMKSESLLVLCDDNIVSGSQASCQLRSWMGVPREEWPAEMRSERGIFQHALRPQDQIALRKIPWAAIVAVGTQEAEDRLKEVAAEIKIGNFKGLYFHEGLDSNCLEADCELSHYLEEVGRNVLSWTRANAVAFDNLTPADKESCARDALGYDGKRGLLATIFNIPVSTCTALWCPGIHRGQPWVPLMIRRGYLNKLVVG